MKLLTEYTTGSEAQSNNHTCQESDVRAETDAVNVTEHAIEMRTVETSSLILDPKLQPRVAFKRSILEEYAEALRSGAQFPPIIVYAHQGKLYVADGHLRVRAARLADKTTVQAEIRDGDIEDAIFHAAGANGKHGLRLTNADKRKAAKMVLLTDRGKTLSNESIAAICLVSPPLVASVKKELTQKGHTFPTEVTCRDGLTRKTGGIGKRSRKAKPATKQATKAQEESSASPEKQDNPETDSAEEGEERTAFSREATQVESGGQFPGEAPQQVAEEQEHLLEAQHTPEHKESPQRSVDQLLQENEQLRLLVEEQRKEIERLQSEIAELQDANDHLLKTKRRLQERIGRYETLTKDIRTKDQAKRQELSSEGSNFPS